MVLILDAFMRIPTYIKKTIDFLYRRKNDSTSSLGRYREILTIPFVFSVFEHRHIGQSKRSLGFLNVLILVEYDIFNRVIGCIHSHFDLSSVSDVTIFRYHYFKCVTITSSQLQTRWLAGRLV